MLLTRALLVAVWVGVLALAGCATGKGYSGVYASGGYYGGPGYYPYGPSYLYPYPYAFGPYPDPYFGSPYRYPRFGYPGYRAYPRPFGYGPRWGGKGRFRR
jgi:hypothetical protein